MDNYSSTIKTRKFAFSLFIPYEKPVLEASDGFSSRTAAGPSAVLLPWKRAVSVQRLCQSLKLYTVKLHLNMYGIKR